MSNDIKKEARKQFFHFFRIWFIVIGILLVITAVVGVKRLIESYVPRTNHSAPEERIYDYADVLTDEEEERLRRKIAKVEARLHIDIVLVMFDQPVEGEEAMKQYGYRSTDWGQNMMDYADDFWDENQYGYNSAEEGDGCILVHNWYEGQDGEHLSTSGSVEARFSVYDIDFALSEVDMYYAANPYKAYASYIDRIDYIMSGNRKMEISWPVVFLVPVVVAFFFALINLSRNGAPVAASGRFGEGTVQGEVAKAVLIPRIVRLLYALAMLLFQKRERETTAEAYVEGGKPVMKARTDDFIRKNVVTRRIETSSGSGGRSGGSSRSGGGGHHVSRSGASHGGGSHRH